MVPAYTIVIIEMTWRWLLVKKITTLEEALKRIEKLEKENGKAYVKNLGKEIAAFARDVSANVLAAVIANMVKPC